MSADQIKEDFKRKSDSYYEMNYLANKNLNRQFRQELIRSMLSNLPLQDKEVLDAGSGPGVLGEVVQSFRAKYFASDISFHNIAAARKRIGAIPGVVADSCALPFADNSFDVVVSIGSVEYIPDADRAIREMCRVLKKEGTFIFTIASNQSPANFINDRLLYPFKQRKMQQRGKPLYKRYFTSLSKMKTLLKECGLEVQEVHYITPGILDNQLKKISILNKLERKLLKHFKLLSKMNKEIVIQCRRAAGPQGRSII